MSRDDDGRQCGHAATVNRSPEGSEDVGVHPWAGIDLHVYEQHMSDAAVGQLQLLHQITGDQLTAFPARAVGILGVAGGNGLDLIDPATTDAVFGYDINGDYLAACERRYRERFGARLHLISERRSAERAPENVSSQHRGPPTAICGLLSLELWAQRPGHFHAQTSGRAANWRR